MKQYEKIKNQRKTQLEQQEQNKKRTKKRDAV